MNRRGFLGAILAAAAAPAIVRADSLMRIVPSETLLLDYDYDVHVVDGPLDVAYVRREVLRIAQQYANLHITMMAESIPLMPRTIKIRQPNRYQVRG